MERSLSYIASCLLLVGALAPSGWAGETLETVTMDVGVSAAEGGYVHVVVAVDPAHEDVSLTISVQRKARKKWKTFSTSTASYDPAMGYETLLKNPTSGKCRVLAKFPGDADHNKASESFVYNCAEPPQGMDGGDGEPGGGNGPACPAGGPGFTELPLDRSDFTNIQPMGNVDPPGHTFPTDHLYLMLTGNEDDGRGDIVPFYSPGDAVVDTIESSDVSGRVTEYKVTLNPCGTVYVYFGHIGPISNKLMTAIETTEPQECRTYSPDPSTTVDFCRWTGLGVSVEAGEQLGYTSGEAAAFDMGAYDYSKSLDFVSPARHNNQSTVCPSDLYVPSVRTEFESLYGDYSGSFIPRTISPRCGRIDQDLAGTAQGYWYIDATVSQDGNSEQREMALVHENIDPNEAVASIGTSVPNLESDGYVFMPSSSGQVNRDFSDITANGKVYCFEGEGRSNSAAMILQLMSATTLKFEKLASESCGAGPWTFTNQAVTFYR